MGIHVLPLCGAGIVFQSELWCVQCKHETHVCICMYMCVHAYMLQATTLCSERRLQSPAEHRIAPEIDGRQSIGAN